MKRVEIKLIGSAAEEWERLNKVVAEERDKGVQNSENQLLSSLCLIVSRPVM